MDAIVIDEVRRREQTCDESRKYERYHRMKLQDNNAEENNRGSDYDDYYGIHYRKMLALYG